MKVRPRGLPGGIVPPAALVAFGLTIFIVGWRHPEWIDLGPHLSAPGIGVLVAAGSLLWLLVAIAKRPPS